MENRKSYIFVIVLTALITCLGTNIFRDLAYSGDEGKALRKISAVKNMLSEYSLFEVDEKKVSDYAAMAMAAAIDDPYTAYFTEEDFSSFKANITSSYVGVGATIGADTEKNELVIISPMEGSPAEAAGLKAGDIITAIDGRYYEAARLNEAAAYLKNGEKGSTVEVSVIREDGTSAKLTITRDDVIKISVKSKILENNIGYLRITGFESKTSPSERDTYDEFCENLAALKSSGAEKLIIDLRGNPGGDLNVVCKIADDIIGEGIITYTEDKHGKRTTISSDKDELNIPIVVLTDGGSASASEVLTGALKDYGKATVVGEKTYGKGIVQTVYPFSDGSGISITTAKYYTPNGVCIHQIGIEPDYQVSLDTDKSISELTLNEDLQLQKAIELLQ